MIRETDHLQPALLLAAPKRIPDLRLFRRNIITARVPSHDNQPFDARSDRKVRAGIKGQADLYGFWRGGWPIEIEFKSVTARSTPEQIRWAEWCREWGVPHLLLRALKEETLDETVQRWLGQIEALRPAR